MPVLARIRFRTDTAANWAAVNPVLAAGELGADSTNNTYKIGNGVSTWNALPVASGVAGPTGAAGATGATGPVGPAGTANAFAFSQGAPALTWTINHNRGSNQTCTLYSVGGVEIEADVINTSVNQIIVTFAVPTAGTARLL